jgi:hypothetical protein
MTETRGDIKCPNCGSNAIGYGENANKIQADSGMPVKSKLCENCEEKNNLDNVLYKGGRKRSKKRKTNKRRKKTKRKRSKKRKTMKRRRRK